MILTIFGLPQEITYSNLKKLIQVKCRVSQFLLDNFIEDSDSKKKIKICVVDEIEANSLIKGLDGYKLAENTISVVPIPWKTHTVEQSSIRINTTVPCSEKIDNHVSSSVQAYIKVKDLPLESKSKKKKKNKKSKSQRLAAKQAMSNCYKIQTPILIKDLVAKTPIQCEPDLGTQYEPVNQLNTIEQQKEPTTSTNMSVPIEEPRKRSKEMTKSDELVMDMLDQKRIKHEIISLDEDESICAIITSGLTGHLCHDAADLVLKSIHSKLVEDSKLDIDIPVFTKNPLYMDGSVKLFCADENSFNWLETVVVDPELMGGMPLTINKVDYNGKFMCGIEIPDKYGSLKNPRFILRLLSRQNRWIDVDCWQFVGSEPETDNYFMKVLVPRDHINVLISKDRKMAYSIGSVNVKFLGQAKRFMFKKYQSL